MPLPMQNYDEAKRNATFMTMRAAQKTAQKNGQAWMGEAPKTSGTSGQKVATGIGIAAVVAVLVILSALRII